MGEKVTAEQLANAIVCGECGALVIDTGSHETWHWEQRVHDHEA